MYNSVADPDLYKSQWRSQGRVPGVPEPPFGYETGYNFN